MKKLLVISDAPILKEKFSYFAYSPYVKEMDIWMKYANVFFVCPTKYSKPLLKTAFHCNPNVKSIPKLSFTSFSDIFKSFFKFPYLLIFLILEIRKHDHIHLRCPGSIGLVACITQILFPSKQKTVKYAGNWDPTSKQPLSYKLQKKILSNTFLTKNCKVLVYGNWQNQTKNIFSFFTASYTNKEIVEIPNKTLKSKINFIFVGSFSDGKRPLLSVKVVEELIKSGVKNVKLNMYGNGEEFNRVKKYIVEKKLQDHITMHGNQQKNIVKEAFIKSHFLIFISKSEGWPKVVAEAMFWGCLPIASKVSCVEDMLGYGDRGTVIEPSCNEKEVVKIVKEYLNGEISYKEKVVAAKKWSQQYTLDKFELEIKKFL